MNYYEFPYGALEYRCPPLTDENGEYIMGSLQKLWRAQKVLDQFWGRVEVSEGCWLWTGAKRGGGYGTVRIEGRGWGAHQFSYYLFTGVDPKGLFVRHTCDTPACVNPRHLLLGTHQDNMDDMVSRGRQVKGGRVQRAKLNEKIAAKILRKGEWKSGDVSRLAKKLGVERATVSRVRNRHTWRHVPAPRQEVTAR